MKFPTIIQGGMGVGVSGWRLARAVSQRGQLGVVSGTALDVVLAGRLQLGDPGGHMQRALSRFPIPGIAEAILRKYYVSGGKPAGEPFRYPQAFQVRSAPEVIELSVAANFAEVFLAKEGHDGVVGINYLEKIQLPTLSALFGAMLAGVDYVLMGAGVPRAIPGILDKFATGQNASLSLNVTGLASGEDVAVEFSPADFCGSDMPSLQRPRFLAIVASSVLATTLARKSSGRVDGFVVEGPTAGGHNAPPRGTMSLNSRGEPVYGPRDVPDWEQIRQLGLPFWLGGGYGHPGKLAEALELGATGVQVGTPFAFCEESDIVPELKKRVLDKVKTRRAEVLASPLASPTGFPFQVLQCEGTVSDREVYSGRSRVCDFGRLRELYRKPDGTVGYRCAAEPLDDYVRKGGNIADTAGRVCLCNGLLVNIGLGQIRAEEYAEPPLLTAGVDISEIGHFVASGRDTYSARDVLDYVLGNNSAA